MRRVPCIFKAKGSQKRQKTKERECISVVVMQQVKMQECRPGNSPDQLEQNLPDIYQVSPGHPLMPSRCPGDALQMPLWMCFSWKGTGWSSTGHLQGIYRASTGHRGWPADVSPRNSEIGQASTGYLQGIYRASGDGLQKPLQD